METPLPLVPVCSWGPNTLWEKGEHGNTGGIQATCGDTIYIFQTKLTDKCIYGRQLDSFILKIKTAQENLGCVNLTTG